jgi:DNA repair protein RadC
MARREWHQLELRLPVAGDVSATYETAPPPRRRSSPQPIPDPATLSDSALLTSLFGPNAERICETLTNSYRGLRSLSLAHPADLRDLGLTPATLHRHAAVFEIARRFGEQEFVPGEPYRGSYGVYAHFRERLAAEPVEHFIAVLLSRMRSLFSVPS